MNESLRANIKGNWLVINRSHTTEHVHDEVPIIVSPISDDSKVVSTVKTEQFVPLSEHDDDKDLGTIGEEEHMGYPTIEQSMQHQCEVEQYYLQSDTLLVGILT